MRDTSVTRFGATDVQESDSWAVGRLRDSGGEFETGDSAQSVLSVSLWLFERRHDSHAGLFHATTHFGRQVIVFDDEPHRVLSPEFDRQEACTLAHENVLLFVGRP